LPGVEFRIARVSAAVIRSIYRIYRLIYAGPQGNSRRAGKRK
jgi:hypothetical protein